MRSLRGRPIRCSKLSTQLHSLRHIDKIVEQIQRLLKSGVPGKHEQDVRFLVLREALLFAPRAGEKITLEWLQQVPGVVAAWGSKREAGFSTNRLNEQGELLVRAIVPAGHFDRRDIVKQLVDEFSNLIHGKKDEERFKLINVVGAHSLRVMKKLGMRDEIDRFYSKLHGEILRGAAMGELRKRYSTTPTAWSGVLQTSLNLAGGWLSFGMIDRAEPILLRSANELLTAHSMKLDVTEYTGLASAYVSALGQGPSEIAVDSDARTISEDGPQTNHQHDHNLTKLFTASSEASLKTSSARSSATTSHWGQGAGSGWTMMNTSSAAVSTPI